MGDALTISATFAAATWVLWTIWYTVRARWWKTGIGFNTFLVSAVLAVVLSRIAWARLDIGFKEQAWIGTTVYVLAGLAAIARYLLFKKAQREGRNKT